MDTFLKDLLFCNIYEVDEPRRYPFLQNTGKKQ